MYVHTVREEKATEQSLTLNVFCTSLTHNYIRGLKAFSGGLLLGIHVSSNIYHPVESL